MCAAVGFGKEKTTTTNKQKTIFFQWPSRSGTDGDLLAQKKKEKKRKGKNKNTNEQNETKTTENKQGKVTSLKWIIGNEKIFLR